MFVEPGLFPHIGVLLAPRLPDVHLPIMDPPNVDGCCTMCCVHSGHMAQIAGDGATATSYQGDDVHSASI